MARLDFTVDSIQREYAEAVEAMSRGIATLRSVADAKIGATPAGGVQRLTLSDEDKQARDLCVKWLEALDLEITIDEMGSIFGIPPSSAARREANTVFATSFSKACDVVRSTTFLFDVGKISFLRIKAGW